VNEFVEECSREWRRLHVPDPIANEMAADLEADLQEAAAEGASAEQVLGSGAFDPRAFAASWAAERGVAQVATAPEPLPTPRTTRRRWLGVLAAVVGATLVGLVVLVGAALAFGHINSSRTIAAPVTRRVPLPPFPTMPVGPETVHVARAPVALGAIGFLILLVVVIGLVVTVLFWRPWHDSSRSA
jgi:hypothetical protein